MNQNRTRAALVVVTLSALLASGCGGSDTLSAKEFRSQANKLCADANKDTDGYGAKITETSSDADVTEAIDKTVKRNDELVDDIDALNAPKSMADDVDSMLKSVRTGIKELDKISSVKDLTSFDPSTLNDANAKATKLGLDDCAG
jgi:hypothetical protein